MTRPPSMIVDRTTTLTQLQEFTKDLKDTKRLHGKQNEDGTITLYVKDAKRGLGSKLFGHSDKSIRKHDMARQAIDTVFKNTERAMSDKTLETVRKALPKTTGGELTGLGAKLLVRGAESKVYVDKGVVSGPGLESLPRGTRTHLVNLVVTEIAGLSNNGGDRQTSISKLGARIADEFLIMTSSKKCENLALSNGSTLKNDLRKQIEPLLRQMLGPDDPVLTDESFLDALLDDTFEYVAEQLLPNRQISENVIKVGDHEYRFEKQFREGANGTVALYFCDDAEKYIVLKTSKAGDSEGTQAMARELKAHRSANGQDNIVGLLGPVRMMDGAIGIALEYAPHGDFDDAMRAINEAMTSNQISGDQARTMRLTLLRDVTDGLRHMQSLKRGQGVLHLDFGSRNMFVGEGGVGKIGDFGLSTKTTKFDVEITKKATNTYMVAPEVTEHIAENLRIRAPIESKTSEGYQSTLVQVTEQFGELGDRSFFPARYGMASGTKKRAAARSTPRRPRLGRSASLRSN